MKIKSLDLLKSFLFISTVMLAWINTKAQKKLVPVSKSSITGIALPSGSKQDGRLLLEISGKALLETQAKKVNTVVRKTEVFYLPASAAGADPDSIVQQLTVLGWSIIPVQGDDKFVWLQKDNRYVITYFSLNKKNNDLYFGEVANAPVISTNENKNIAQNANTNSQQNTLQTDQQQNVQQQSGQQQSDPQQVVQNISTTPAKQYGFAFTTTNFEDGCISVVFEDWVEVIKGNIKVLLHYPKQGTIFPADPDVLTNAAWNILIAPRYSNLRNYKTTYITSYNRPHLGMGTATDNVSGKDVFIVLYRQGQTGWIEFIAPDKNSFIEQYKFDPEIIRWDSDTDLMKPLANMTGYNKFAVAAADFTGKWTSDFTGIQQLYNIYSGDYAGMHMNQSNEEFVFATGNTYNWKLLVVNGMAGNAKFNQVKSSGTFTVRNNWQLHFSKIEGKAVTYHAHWSCIKGARILNLLNAEYPGSGIYTQYGLAK